MILILLLSTAAGLTCSPGNFIDDGNCVECSVGKYVLNETADECTNCPANTYSVSGRSCILCPAGYTSEAGSGFCSECTGTTCCEGLGLQDGTCELCLQGTYSNNNQCETCPAGHVPIVNITNPFNQLTDIVFNENGSNACYECSIGTAPQSGICLPCAVGRFVHQGICQDCAAGTYKTDVYASTCSLCPAGFFAGSASAHCEPCAVNTINTADGSSSCSSCTPLVTSVVVNGTSITTSQARFSPQGSTICHVDCDSFDFVFNESGQCQFCPSGKYTTSVSIQNASQCIQCPTGYVKSGRSSNLCAQCEEPTISNQANDACVECSPGTYYSTGTCQPCAVGMYKDENMDECLNCNSGFYQDQTGQAICKSCPKGKFSSFDELPVTACTDCPTGYIAQENGTSLCLKCAIGTGSEGSTITCTNCSFGTETIDGVCTICAAGKQPVLPNGCELCEYPLASLTSNSTCSECADGTYYINRSFCGTCDASNNQFTNKVGPGSTHCIECLPNSTTLCQECEDGKFNEDGECKPCAPGLFNDGQRYCQECPDTSIPSADNSFCETCADGTFKSSITSCSACPMGYAGTGGICDECVKGQYQEQTGTFSCKVCDVSELETTIATGSSEASDCKTCADLGFLSATVVLQGTCSTCQAGRFVANTKDACLDCPPGRHRSAGDVSCLPCPIGTFSNNILPCQECPSGKYTNQPGQSSCQDCIVTNNNGCDQCSAGYKKTVGNSCEACPVGQFSVAAQEVCQVCGVGLYQDEEASAFCKGCPRGYYNDEQSQSSCKACAKGQFQNVERQGACHECQIGSYENDLASLQCKKCGDGYFTSGEGSQDVSDCLECPMGRFEDKGVCYDCPESTYQDEFATTSCKSCANGEISPLASSNASDCFSIEGLTTYVFGMKSDAKETQEEHKMCEIRPNFLLLCPGCTCDSDSRNGFWDGPICDECQRGFATRTCTVGCPAYDGQHDSTMCNGNGKCWFGKYGNGLCYCGGLSKLDSSSANAVVDLRLCPKGKVCRNYGNEEQTETSYRPIYYIILYRQYSAFVLQLNQYTPNRGHMWFKRYAPNKAYENTCLSCVSAYESNIQTRIGYWSRNNEWQYFHDDIQTSNGFHGENCQYECGLCLNGGKCNNVAHPYHYTYSIENTFQLQKSVSIPTTTCVCSSISFDSDNMCCPNGFQPYIFYGVRGSTPYTRFTQAPFISSIQNRQREYFINKDIFLEPSISLSYAEPDSGYITVTDQNIQVLRSFSEIGPYNKHVYYGVPKDICRACPGLFGMGVESQGNLIDTEAKAESFWWDNAMGAMSRKCNGIGVCDFYKKEREADVHFMGNAKAYTVLAEHRTCNDVAKTGYVMQNGDTQIDTEDKCAEYALQNNAEYFAFTRSYKGGTDADFETKDYTSELSVSTNTESLAYASYLNGTTLKWKRLIATALPKPNSDSKYTVKLRMQRCAIFDSCDSYATYYGFNTYKREKGHGDSRLSTATFNRFDTCFTFTYEDRISVFGLYVTKDYVQGEDPFLGGLCPKGYFCTMYNNIGYKEACPAGYYQDIQGMTRSVTSVQCSTEKTLKTGCQAQETTVSTLDYVDNVCKRCSRNAWSAPGSASCSECPSGRVKKLSGVFDTETKMLNFPTSVSKVQIWYYQEDEQGRMETDCALVPESIIHIPKINSKMSYQHQNFFPVLSCPYGYSSRAGSFVYIDMPELLTLLDKSVQKNADEPITSVMNAPYIKLKKTFDWKIQDKQLSCSAGNIENVEYTDLQSYEDCKKAAFATAGITDVRRRYQNIAGCYYMPDVSDKVAYFGMSTIQTPCSANVLYNVQYFCMEGVNNDELFKQFVIANCFRCPGNSVTGPESGACTTCFANQLKWYTKGALQQATELHTVDFKRVSDAQKNALVTDNTMTITLDIDNLENIVLSPQNTFTNIQGQWLRPVSENGNLEITLVNCYLVCQTVYDAESLIAIAVRQRVPVPVNGQYNGPLCFCATHGDISAVDDSSTTGIVWYEKSDAQIAEWDSEGLPLCSACQPGKKNTGGACVSCPEGYYTSSTSEANRPNCLPCGPGTFQNNGGQSACFSCPAGTYQTSGAQSSCIDCPAGYFDTSGTATQCTGCTIGKFQDIPAQTSCKDCIIGKFQNERNKMSCKICSAGTYQDQTNSQSCKSCVPGRYNPDTGRSSACLECNPGYHQPASGKSSCIACAAGKAQANSGATSCTDCRDSTGYAIGVAQTECSACPGGMKCEATTGTGTTCAEGEFLPPNTYGNCKKCPRNRQSTADKKSCEYCKFEEYNDEVGGSCKSCGQTGWISGNKYLYYIDNGWRFKYLSSKKSNGWSETYQVYYIMKETRSVRFRVSYPDDNVRLTVTKNGGGTVVDISDSWNSNGKEKKITLHKGDRGQIKLRCDNKGGGNMRCQAQGYGGVMDFYKNPVPSSSCSCYKDTTTERFSCP